VLALLAFACFPVFAQADSVEKQYETEVPGVPKETKKQNSVEEPKAGDSKDGGYTAPDTAEETGGESESLGATGGNQGSDGGNKGGAAAGKDAGTSQGSPGNGSSGANQTALGEAAPLATSPQPVDDGGSSSPLVPILIAIAALAAISIGAVVIRQRRQDDGSGGQISPKAS
jgi:hypothetical protein